MVTSLPKAPKTCANSAATNPPPTIASRRGRSSMRMIVSDVWCSTRSSPGIGGTTARLPAAITTWSAVIVSPVPVSSSRTPVNRACAS